MADWQPLRQLLQGVSGSLTLDWRELDTLVGGLPPSASRYREFWSGDRSTWRGFRVSHVEVGRSVTFTRNAGAKDPPRTTVVEQTEEPPSNPRMLAVSTRADVVLVGCAKSKTVRAAVAADLYVSPLFRFARSYAEATAKPWFILSAKHGLVRPDKLLQPYDLNLGDLDRESQERWARQVAADLARAVGGLVGVVVEIHAGETYARHLRERLLRAGAFVGEPLHGLTLGERLAWYSNADSQSAESAADHGKLMQQDELVRQLTDQESARTPAEVVASADATLLQPGMYSWWVDRAGAGELSQGLGYEVAPGLIYAGLAGATRRLSQRRSSNTLHGRLVGMHLGSRYRFSTFRYSLGSVLAAAWDADTIDERRLTSWMHDHLRVLAVPVADPDILEDLEDYVLKTLDPPLNLSKVLATPLRRELTELRRRHKR